MRKFKDDSDVRIHVSFSTQRVYVFETQIVAKLIGTNQYSKKLAYQPGVSYPTSEGYPIPLADIRGLETHRIPQKVWEEHECGKLRGNPKNHGTNIKGEIAMNVVKGMFAELLYLSVILREFIGVKEVKSVGRQIEGVDLDPVLKCKIQVKCDFKAGLKKFGGTGNLYVEESELNPLN